MNQDKSLSDARYKRLFALIGSALGRPSADALVRAVLANRQQGGVSSGSGQTSTFTLPPLVMTAGAPGHAEVSFYGQVSTSAAGDPVAAFLTRDGVQIGPQVSPVTDVNGNASLALGPFVDAPGPGSFVYGVHLANGTLGHTVQTTSGSALVQETL
jgi:hypothetical protein